MDKDRQENRPLEHLLFRDTLEDLALGLSRHEMQLRRQTAGTLHDQLQQLLAGARIYTQLAEGRMEPGETRQNLNEVNRLLEQALGLTRELVLRLCPRVAYAEDLWAALRWLSQWMGEAYNLQVRLEQEGPAVALPEELRLFLFEAVRELLINAASHSGAREATLRVSAEPDRRLHISVEDTGSGFDPLAVLSDGQSGFTLFSLRQLLRLRGGELEVDSRPGAGTRAAITVPLEPAREAVAVAEESAAATTVLVVDDHKIMRDGIIAMLTPLPDIRVVGEAANGREAVDLARQLRPEVILMDVSMPEMNGIEATRRITAETPGVHIIALSMFDDPQVAESMKRAGAVAYLNKGDQTDELVATIRKSR